MANFGLKNINIATIPILTIDSSGDKVPAIPGDVFSVVSSDVTKLTAVMSADGTAIVLTPMVKLMDGLTVTVSDTDALTSDIQIVDIVADLTPSAVSLDLAGATFTTQPAPTV